MSDDFPHWTNKPLLSPTEAIKYRGVSLPSAATVLSTEPYRYDLQSHWVRSNNLYENYTLRDEDAARAHTLQLLKTVIENCDAKPTLQLCQALYDLVYELFAANSYYAAPPPPKIEYATRSLLEFLDLCYDATRRLEAEKIVSEFVADIFAFLPPSARTSENDQPFSVPIHATVRDVAALVEYIAMHLSYKTDKNGTPLFLATRGQVSGNVLVASGYTRDEQEPRKIVSPRASRLPPDDLIQAYLGQTSFEPLLHAPVPFPLPDEQRFSGHWIVAPAGRGKTTVLHSMFLADLPREASIIVIDSKGDLIGPIKTLAAVKDRLVLIEPDPEAAFALNPFDVPKSNAMHAVSLIEYVMAGLLDAKFTALQSTLFRNVVPAIIEGFSAPTIDTFKTVMTKGLPAEMLDKLNPHAAQFFSNRETGFYSKTYESTRKEVVWRLDYLMTNPVLRQMFSAVQTKLDISKEMDAGKVIVIDNSKALLTDEGAEFFGRFFIALILRAAQQRAGRRQEDKKPCYVYIDECHTVIAKDTRVPTILDECRSQKIALILAHQRTAQLTAPIVDAVANSAIRMANSDDEAKFLSDKLRMSVDDIRGMPKGTFGTFVRDVTPRGVALKVPYVDLSTMPKMTGREQEEVRAKMRALFGVDLVEPAATRSEAVAERNGTPTQPEAPVAAEATRPAEKLAEAPDPSAPEAGVTW